MLVSPWGLLIPPRLSFPLTPAVQCLQHNLRDTITAFTFQMIFTNIITNKHILWHHYICYCQCCDAGEKREMMYIDIYIYTVYETKPGSRSAFILYLSGEVIRGPCSSLSRQTGHICRGDWVAPGKRRPGVNISAGTRNIWTLGRSSWKWVNRGHGRVFMRATHRSFFGRFEVAMVTHFVISRRGFPIGRAQLRLVIFLWPCFWIKDESMKVGKN